jgi:hypothetical protein
LIKLVGAEVAHLRLASAVLGGLTPIVVTWAGRVGLGRIEGILAGLVTAFYGPLVFADGCLEKEGLAALLTAAALGLVASLCRGSRWPLASAGGAGIAWGAAALLRSNAIVAAPATLVWLWPRKPWLAGAPKGGWRTVLLSFVFLLGFSVLVIPVAAINTTISDPPELMGTTWQLGPNFYIGNGPGATGTYWAPAFVRAHPAYEAADYAMEASRRLGRHLSPGQVSRYWFAEGLKQWAAEPVGSLRLGLVKLDLMIHREEIPDNQDLEFVRTVAAPVLWGGFVNFGLIFPFAVIGLGGITRSRFLSYVALVTVVGMAATVLFFVVGRYRIPWIPGVILLAAAGAVDLFRVARARDLRGLAWRLGLLGLPAALWCWRPRADPVPTRWGTQLIALAVAELRSGRVEPALDALDLARASGADVAERIRQLTAEGPVHDLIADARNRSGNDVSGVPVTVATLLDARLDRQLLDRRSQARNSLMAALRSRPDDPVANREWGAYLISWAAGSADRSRAVNALEKATHAIAPDQRARLMEALLTGNSELVDLPLISDEPHLRALARLVRAIVESRRQGWPFSVGTARAPKMRATPRQPAFDGARP